MQFITNSSRWDSRFDAETEEGKSIMLAAKLLAEALEQVLNEDPEISDELFGVVAYTTLRELKLITDPRLEYSYLERAITLLCCYDWYYRFRLYFTLSRYAPSR